MRHTNGAPDASSNSFIWIIVDLPWKLMLLLFLVEAKNFSLTVTESTLMQLNSIGYLLSDHFSLGPSIILVILIHPLEVIFGP